MNEIKPEQKEEKLQTDGASLYLANFPVSLKYYSNCKFLQAFELLNTHPKHFQSEFILVWLSKVITLFVFVQVLCCSANFACV